MDWVVVSVRLPRLDVTLLSGHLISWNKGVHDVDDASALSIRVAGAEGRVGSIGPLTGGAGSDME